jgi:hypothetical protein
MSKSLLEFLSTLTREDLDLVFSQNYVCLLLLRSFSALQVAIVMKLLYYDPRDDCNPSLTCSPLLSKKNHFSPLVFVLPGEGNHKSLQELVMFGVVEALAEDKYQLRPVFEASLKRNLSDSLIDDGAQLSNLRMEDAAVESHDRWESTVNSSLGLFFFVTFFLFFPPPFRFSLLEIRDWSLGNGDTIPRRLFWPLQFTEDC